MAVFKQWKPMPHDATCLVARGLFFCQTLQLLHGNSLQPGYSFSSLPYVRADILVFASTLSRMRCPAAAMAILEAVLACQAAPVLGVWSIPWVPRRSVRTPVDVGEAGPPVVVPGSRHDPQPGCMTSFQGPEHHPISSPTPC